MALISEPRVFSNMPASRSDLQASKSGQQIWKILGGDEQMAQLTFTAIGRMLSHEICAHYMHCESRGQRQSQNHSQSTWPARDRCGMLRGGHPSPSLSCRADHGGHSPRVGRTRSGDSSDGLLKCFGWPMNGADFLRLNLPGASRSIPFREVKWSGILIS